MPSVHAGAVPRFHRWFHALVWCIGTGLNLVAFRLRVRGAEHLPDGGFLLLPNHTSFFDPYWTTWALRRPLRFMTSAQLFRLPVARHLVTWLGAFPKRKFVPDRAAVRVALRSLRAGVPVLVFPEGNRTWDGRTQAILPHLGKLVRAGQAPVVTCRVSTGHLFQPRWAHYPRWVPVHVEYDPPVTFDADADPAAIDVHVQRAITLDPDPPVPPGSWGWRMAHGLPDYLWACPSCLTLDALSVHPRSGNAVCCAACGAAWDLDVGQRLTPRADRARDAEGAPLAPTFTVAEAHDHLLASVLPALDALTDRGLVRQLDEDGIELAAWRGHLVLTPDHLEVHPDPQRPAAAAGPAADPPPALLRVPLAQVRAVSMEVANTLQVRTDGALYELRPDAGRRIQWLDVLAAWVEAVGRGRGAGAPVVA